MKKIITVVMIGITIIGGGVAWYLMNRTPKSDFFNEQILAKVNFTLLAPREYTRQQQATIKYDDQQNNVSYVLPYGDQTFIVSMQALPNEFVNDQTYIAYVDQQDRIDKLDTKLGTAYIIRPAAFAGTETATLRYEDTLVFIRASETNIEISWQDVIQAISTPVN